MQGLTYSLPCGKVFGIPVRLHYLFLVLLVAQVLFSIYYGGLWPLYWFLILGPILLFTILVHELGHCLAARQVGGEAHSILLWPLGGLAFIGHDKGPKVPGSHVMRSLTLQSRGTGLMAVALALLFKQQYVSRLEAVQYSQADIWVAVAGPLTHVPMTIFWLLMLLVATWVAYRTTHITLDWPNPLTTESLGIAICVGAVLLNITVFAFNLLVPAYPLDGGRILVDSLLTCGVAETTACKITIGVAAPIAVGIIVLGAVWFQVVTILVGVWILWASWQLFDCLRKGQLAQHPMFAFTSQQHAATASPAAAAVSFQGQQGQAQQPQNPFAGNYNFMSRLQQPASAGQQQQQSRV